MASDDLLGTVRRLMWAEYPSGTHLSQSSTPGGSSALARNDVDTLVTHAALFPAENAIKAGAAVCVSVGIVVGIVAVKATPRAKKRFNDLKPKRNHRPQGNVEAATQKARPLPTDMGVEKL
ncbi:MULTISPECIES: hypothetical protein [Actinomadura]|uniref:Transmembrane protein n=1 Tax=Actinomadura yumaensis TaxID=111807 RepID=A0ABW2CL73_9ACTN|nr:hypothetical protein [Actinomadura sp. J1-007]MWK37110.1 hypothetical protein [Actinomadura sp. J1-007]